MPGQRSLCQGATPGIPFLQKNATKQKYKTQQKYKITKKWANDHLVGRSLGFLLVSFGSLDSQG